MNAKDRYLFEKHRESVVARWCGALKHFRFCRAYGGFAGDGDSFQTSIEFSGEAELLRVMQTLGVGLKTLPPDNPAPVVGKSYTGEEYGKFRVGIDEFPQYETPGWVNISGVAAFVRAANGRVEIHLSGAADGNLYDVSERDFENARLIEKQLEPCGLRFVHPPIQCQCLCAKCHRKTREGVLNFTGKND